MSTGLVKKRPITWSDLDVINELAENEDFHVGMHNLKLYYETSPKSWDLVENEQREIVGYSANNRFSGGQTVHTFQLVIRNDYRGKGLTKIFDTMHYTKTPQTGNATENSILRYKFDSLSEKLYGYFGFANNLHILKSDQYQLENLSIDKIGKNRFVDIADYDFSISGIERRNFLYEWIFPDKYPCYTAGYMATIDNVIRGYCILREYKNYFVISPLYADNDKIAAGLLYKIMASLDQDQELYALFPSDKNLMMDMVTKMNFSCCDKEMRTYSNMDMKSISWDMKRAYALMDYWPV